MPLARVIGERLEGCQILVGGSPLEGSNADVAGCNAGKHSPRKRFWAEDVFARHRDR